MEKHANNYQKELHMKKERKSLTEWIDDLFWLNSLIYLFFKLPYHNSTKWLKTAYLLFYNPDGRYGLCGTKIEVFSGLCAFQKLQGRLHLLFFWGGGCWQNLVPYSYRTEVTVFLLPINCWQFIEGCSEGCSELLETAGIL